MELRRVGTIPTAVQVNVWVIGGRIPAQSAWQTTVLASSSWQQLCTVAATQDSGHTELFGELIMKTSNVSVDVDQVTWTEK
jgi:hypothetical protein